MDTNVEDVTNHRAIAETMRPACWFATIMTGALYALTIAYILWSVGHDALPGMQPLVSHRVLSWIFGVSFMIIGSLALLQMKRRIPKELHWPVAAIPHLAILGGVVLFGYGFAL